MSFAMRGWLWAARRRNRVAAPKAPWVNRREVIERYAPGKSFIDLGGMWSVHGDAAFIAEEVGASRAVLFDGMDPSPEFEQKHAERSSAVNYVQGDLHDPRGMEELGAFDVVWCTGVLYHTPNPYLVLEHLRRITGEYLILGSHVIPEVPGLPQACLWYPGLSQAERDFLGKHPGEHSPGMADASKPFDEAPGAAYANNWWGIPPSALRSMLAVARFEVVEEFQYDRFSIDVVARPVDRESVVPPVDFARERGAARVAEAGDSPPGWL